MLHHSLSPIQIRHNRSPGQFLNSSAVLVYQQPIGRIQQITNNYVPFAQSRLLASQYSSGQQLQAKKYGLSLDRPFNQSSMSPIKVKVPSKSFVSVELNQGQPSQVVTIIFDDKKYVGQTKKTSKHGIGTLYDKKQSIIYQGSWKDNQYHGKGILNNIDNPCTQFQQYVGEFMFNYKQGAGIEYYKDGSYFVGNFVQNQKDGFGTLYKKQQHTPGVWRKDVLLDEF